MSACTKRAYSSLSAAKRAHSGAHYRIRPYRCGDCGLVHVANADKTPPLGQWRPAGRKKRTRELAPVMTLEQVEAIAAEKRKGART